MSEASAHSDKRSTACRECERRSWLLSALSASLDYRARDRPRLVELLALEDAELICALGGTRRQDLFARHRAFEPEQTPATDPARAICRHCEAFPESLIRHPSAPRLLHLTGGDPLGHTPLVAIVGSRRASDYGMQMARSLARELASCGVGVVSGLGDGIAMGALGGALDGEGLALAVVGSGLGVSPPAHRQALYRRLLRSGCVVSELPHSCSGRRWGAVAAERTIAALAELTVVVEAEERAEDLAVAELARSWGGVVAAIPGRVTSVLSTGTHALLMGGAHLVRDAGDVLDLLHHPGPPTGSGTAAGSELTAELEPRLERVLREVGTGRDTPDRLAGPGVEEAEVLLALSELELLGLLARGEGGRYVPCNPCS